MLSQEIIKKIKHIEIQVRRLLSGTCVGDNSSAIKGSGFDFDQIREYQQGDDVRYIDWKGSARAQKLLVRQYIEDRSRTIVLAVDTSSSLFFSSTDQSKYEVISQIAGMLALVANYGKDNSALVLFSDEIEAVIPPSAGRAHVHLIMEKIFSVSQKKTAPANITKALETIVQLKRQDSVVFILSDFIENDFDRALGAVVKRYDTTMIRCLDPLERALPAVGLLPLVGSGQKINGPQESTKKYIDTRRRGVITTNYLLKERINLQNKLFKKYGASFLDVHTDRPFFDDILMHFRRHMRY